MATLTTESKPAYLAEVLRRLGGIPPERIRMNPAPGTATEKDLRRAGKPICELIDGVLVEKAVGTAESMMGSHIFGHIWTHVRAHDLGVVLAGDGFIRIRKGLVRAPDVTFIPWSSLPNGEYPKETYWSVTPGLIVEVLSPTNRRAEIDRKLREFFKVGCPLAWVVNPKSKTAKVYTAPDRFTELTGRGVLKADPVLPGFTVSLAEVFGLLKRPKST